MGIWSSKTGSSQPSLLLRVCLAGLLISVGVALRLLPIRRYVTPDEPAWVFRSTRFLEALQGGDWGNTPVTGHPGVTTMWLGAAGIAVKQAVDPTLSSEHLSWVRKMAWLSPENAEAFGHLAYFLPAGRVAAALGNVLGLVVLYPILTRLLGTWAATLSIVLLTFDPFFIGHSCLLHTDALLATFSLLTLTSALNGLMEPGRHRWPALAGAFAGLAILTKSTGAFLLPFIGLISLLWELKRGDTKVGWPRVLARWARHGALFMTSGIGVYFLLNPRLWADPTETVLALVSFAATHVTTAQRPVYFAGAMVYDPGPLFYPAVLAFRLSPVGFLGLALAAAVVTLRRFRSPTRRIITTMLVFAASFGAAMSIAAKQHDRYLLPVFPVVTCAASASVDALLTALARNGLQPHSADRRRIAVFITTSAIQAALALAFLPYPLTYFNPLAGGPTVAQRVLSTDWGEGASAAALWLNQQKGARDLTVASASIPSFASYFAGHTVQLEQAFLSDYVVCDQVCPEATLEALPVAHVTQLKSVDHSVVHRNAGLGELERFLAASAAPGDLVLLDAGTPSIRRDLAYLEIVEAADFCTPSELAAALAGSLNAESTLWLVESRGTPRLAGHQARRELERVARRVSTSTVGHATVSSFVRSDETPAAPARLLASFDGQIDLVDALAPTDPLTSSFPVYVRWRVAHPVTSDLRATTRLVDDSEHIWEETGQLIVNRSAFPTSSWSRGECADLKLNLDLPPFVAPGRYALQLAVSSDETGAQIGVSNPDGRFVGTSYRLGKVEIAPPLLPAGAPVCDSGRTYTGGPLTACLPDPLAHVATPGQSVAFPIVWTANQAPTTAYGLMLSLVDSQGTRRMEHTYAVSSFDTARWRAGDTFESVYDLRVDPEMTVGTYTATLQIVNKAGAPVSESRGFLGSLEVPAVVRQFEVPEDIAFPMNTALGEFARLRGSELRPSAPTPGDTVEITLYWLALRPSQAPLTVFVHVVNESGIVGQSDTVPAGGTRPTTGWVTDEVIVDRHWIILPDDVPPGDLAVMVGMYDHRDGVRLATLDQSGATVGDAVILPVSLTIQPKSD